MVSAAGPQLFQSWLTQSGAGRLTRSGRAVGVGVIDGISVAVGVWVPGGIGEAVDDGSGVGEGEDSWVGATNIALGVGIASTGCTTPRR